MKGTWQGQESICQPVSLKSNLLPFTTGWQIVSRPCQFPFMFIRFVRCWNQTIILGISSPSKHLLLYPSVYYIVTCVTLWDNFPQNCFYYTLLHTVYLPASLCETGLPQNFFYFILLYSSLRHFVRQSASKVLLLYPSMYHYITCVILWDNLPQNFFYFTLLYTV